MLFIYSVSSTAPKQPALLNLERDEIIELETKFVIMISRAKINFRQAFTLTNRFNTECVDYCQNTHNSGLFSFEVSLLIR
jgi:hypothetical protein